MQRSDGNCPLIALVNLVCLQQRIELPKTLNPNELLSLAVELYPEMTELIFNHSEELLKGSFVDPMFKGIFDFNECLLLKFNIPIVHGWVLDPNDPLSNKLTGYDQGTMLMTKSPEDDAIKFLNCNQLTINGLQALYQLEPTPFLGILFRNNHFNVLYKRGQGQLYQLVTDEGFRNTSITWETLALDGDSSYFDADFHPRQQSIDGLNRDRSNENTSRNSTEVKAENHQTIAENKHNCMLQ